jgi:hypothetical protein
LIAAILIAQGVLASRAEARPDAGVVRVRNNTDYVVHVWYRLNFPGITGAFDIYKDLCVPKHSSQESRYDDQYALVSVNVKVLSENNVQNRCESRATALWQSWVKGSAGSHHAYSIDSEWMATKFKFLITGN